jgi:hypothetical protein
MFASNVSKKDLYINYYDDLLYMLVMINIWPMVSHKYDTTATKTRRNTDKSC